MAKKTAILIAALVLTATSNADDKHALTVVGVGSKVQSAAVDHYVSSGNAQADTNCNITDNSANCHTQAQGGANGTHFQTYINRFDAVVDGGGKRFLMTCWEKWRWDTCIRPVQGQSYQAEVSGKTMWIKFPQDMDGKKFKKVKYKIEQILQ